MPKFDRKQRFAVLKNIYDELGELGVLRSAARLQVPAAEARALCDEWAGGAKARLPEEEPAPARPPRPMTAKPASPPRPPRVETAKAARPPRPARAPSVIKIGEASLPAEKITGDDYVEGYKGAKLFKGMHVRYREGNAVGVIVNLGKQQSEVKWFRTGATQSEVNSHLERK